MKTPDKQTDQKPAPDSSLGSIPKGATDSKLDSKPVPARMEKAAAPKLEKLDLPKGALIAYRRSGGLKFSSDLIVVYPDGRVSYGGPDAAKQTRQQVARKLNDGQISGLRKLLDQCNFFGFKTGGGQQPPDSYAHEIMARSGKRNNFLEVFDGGIPDALRPLVEQLNALLPKEK
jgi:hypothetical protein